MKTRLAFAATGLGNKYEQLLRKVNDMETHATRTGAWCKKPIKDLKQRAEIPGSTTQGMKAILGSVKLLENDIQGG